MMAALKQVRINVSPQDLIKMAQILDAHEEVSYGKKNPSWNGKDEDNVIHYIKLLKACRDYFSLDLEQEEDDEPDE